MKLRARKRRLYAMVYAHKEARNWMTDEEYSWEFMRPVGREFGSPDFERLSRSCPARVTFEDGTLKAALLDGRAFLAHDARELAGQLTAAGIAVEDVYCTGWREGDIAPSAGQAIALKAAMRRQGRGRV